MESDDELLEGVPEDDITADAADEALLEETALPKRQDSSGGDVAAPAGAVSAPQQEGAQVPRKSGKRHIIKHKWSADTMAGVDLYSAEEQAKKEARAAKFGLEPPVDEAAERAKLEARAAKFGLAAPAPKEKAQMREKVIPQRRERKVVQTVYLVGLMELKKSITQNASTIMVMVKSRSWSNTKRTGSQKR